jgi:flagellar protein FlgJ
MDGVNDINSLRSLLTYKDKRAALKKASEDFAAIFINIMLKEMKDSLPGNSLIKQSNGEKMFNSMLYQNYSSMLAKNGMSSITNSIYNSLKRGIEVNTKQVDKSTKK